jgi:hypothetical protein
MINVTEWLPMAMVGLMFTGIGSLKLWGLRRGITRIAGKPVAQRFCGTCPTSESRSLRLGFPLLFLGVGLFHLGWLGWLLVSGL